MVNQSLIIKNKIRIQKVAEFKKIRDELKKQIKIKGRAGESVWKYVNALDKMPKDGSPTRVRNRCMITGRSRGLALFKQFGMCGYQIRENANLGYIAGVYKR